MPMRFPYLKAARVKLQERKNACLRSSYEAAKRYAGFFMDFVKTDPVVRTVCAELSIIAQQKFENQDELVDTRYPCLAIPEDVTDCAAYHLRLLELMGKYDRVVPRFETIFGKGSNRYQDMYDDFFGQVLVPLCSYIDERIDDGDLMLYMLSRYQRECMWFEAEELAKRAENADSRKLEDVLDKHLRTWLFREGIDYPFSTPRSPSGRADVIVWQGERPLPIEVKVYDGQNRDLGHVSQGLWQAQRYAHDHGAPFGYLVVFNTASVLLGFQDNIAKEGPACILVGDVNVFAVVVNVATGRDTASKEKPIETKLVKTPDGQSGE